MEIYKIFVLVLFALSVYPFLIYPIILLLLSTFFNNEVNKSYSYQPDVTILVPVHNEEENIYPLVESILNSDYPKEKIRIIFGSDGSNDNTNKYLEDLKGKYENVDFLILPRVGKNLVINHLLPLVKSEIILFIDADVRPEKQTIKEMVAHFNDEEVGGVASNLIVIKRQQGDVNPEERHTQSFFNIIRKLESRIFGTFNNNGPCYAVRAGLINKIPNTKVCDDFFNVLTIFIRGKRMVFAENAIAYDLRPRNTILNEYHRKKRFSAGGLSAIFSSLRIFTRPLFAFFLFSHKILRWLSPVFAILVVILLLIFASIEIKILIAGLLGLFLLAAMIGFVSELKGRRTSKFFRVPLFILLSVAGTIAGIFRSFLGKQNSSWTLRGLETQNEAMD